MHPALGNQNQAPAERTDLYRYDEPETENGVLAGWGDATSWTYFGSFTPTNDYVLERVLRIPVEREEIPYMIKSSRGPTRCGHEAFIWLRGGGVSGWVNVLVSTVLNELETDLQGCLIDHLDRWLRGEMQTGLEQPNPQPPMEQAQQ